MRKNSVRLWILFAVILCLMPRAASATGGESGEQLQEVMEEQKRFEEVLLAQARVNAYGGQFTRHEMQTLLEITGWEADDIEIALEIAWCESRFSPYAVGDGGRSVGLFQLNYDTWYRYAGYYGHQYHDAVVNALVAKKVWEYDRQRYGKPHQWSCYRC